MLHTEKLEESEFLNVRNLTNKRAELVYKIGELQLEIDQLKEIKNSIKKEHSDISLELDAILSLLNVKYPNGEIDLYNGTVTFEK